jgi:hypothetical protein
MDDIVRSKLAQEEYVAGREKTEELKFAGYETLHERSREEIAECLVNVLKSRPRIKRVDWVVGQPLKITYVTQ